MYIGHSGSTLQCFRQTLAETFVQEISKSLTVNSSTEYKQTVRKVVLSDIVIIIMKTHIAKICHYANLPWHIQKASLFVLNL